MTWAMGDSNFHGFTLPGLTSAWSGVGGRDGTLGSHRRIDDVFSNRVASRRLLYSTDSDHQCLAVEYDTFRRL
jgi:hypothetical protein